MSKPSRHTTHVWYGSLPKIPILLWVGKSIGRSRSSVHGFQKYRMARRWSVLPRADQQNSLRV